MNYTDLFRATLPETALEIAALLVLVVDLGLLRKAALKTRVAIAAVLGVAGCGAALWALQIQGSAALTYGDSTLLAAGTYIAVAQTGILVLTALTLLLLIDSVFTRNAGEYVAVVLMASAGGLIIAAAQDLLVIFVGLELLSLGLYILTAFAKSSGKSAEAAMKYYLFGGMSAAFLLFGFSYLYGMSGSTSLPRVVYGCNVAAANGGSPLLILALVMVAAGLGFKVAAVPFHLWAPDTYEGSPAPAAAFIASVSKVASFALLISIGHVTLYFLQALSSGAQVHSFGVVRIVQLSSEPPTFLGVYYLLCHRARRLRPARRRLLLLGQPRRPVNPLLHPHLRHHHHRRLRRHRRRRTCHRFRQTRRLPRPAQTQSAAGRRAARLVPLPRRHPATCRLLGKVQPIRRRAKRFRRPGYIRPRRARHRHERRLALLLFASLKARLCHARNRRVTHQGAFRHAHCPASHCRRSSRLRLLPRAPPKLDRQLLSRDVTFSTPLAVAPAAAPAGPLPAM